MVIYNIGYPFVHVVDLLLLLADGLALVQEKVAELLANCLFELTFIVADVLLEESQLAHGLVE